MTLLGGSRTASHDKHGGRTYAEEWKTGSLLAGSGHYESDAEPGGTRNAADSRSRNTPAPASWLPSRML